VVRIVVIDDEPSIRRSLRLILARVGHDVVEADTGLEGLRRCRETGADLVITDIHMPGLDGIETTAALHAWSPTLPVIVMSGGEQTGHLGLLDSAGLLGAVSTLRKPFTVQEVVDAVALALRSDRAPSEE
jgi:two-component system KDP operon response regulator KdpE